MPSDTIRPPKIFAPLSTSSPPDILHFPVTDNESDTDNIPLISVSFSDDFPSTYSFDVERSFVVILTDCIACLNVPLPAMNDPPTDNPLLKSPTEEVNVPEIFTSPDTAIFANLPVSDDILADSIFPH